MFYMKAKWYSGSLLIVCVCSIMMVQADESGEMLFDGKTLEHWKKTDFAGGGPVEVKEGNMQIRWGEMLSGVNYTGEIPKTNYEVTLEAQRVDGSDFFCGLTFPIGDSHASLIVGGWGGGVIGISSIDTYDASENSTTRYEKFENGKWYKIRLRVTDKKLEAWVDGKQQVDVDREGHEFSVRMEIEDSRPFGLATYQSTGAIRNIRLAKLDPKENEAKMKNVAQNPSASPSDMKAAPTESPSNQKIASESATESAPEKKMEAVTSEGSKACCEQQTTCCECKRRCRPRRRCR